MNVLEVKAADYALVKAWFDMWGEFVANVDFESARPMFQEECISFGTWMDTVEGLDNLIEKQWKTIWPTIESFRFLTDTLRVQISPDRLFAIAIIVWESTGFCQNHKPYHRPGRATVSLNRLSLNSPWKGVHTHMSLCRGIPQTSYGGLP